MAYFKAQTNKIDGITYTVEDALKLDQGSVHVHQMEGTTCFAVVGNESGFTYDIYFSEEEADNAVAAFPDEVGSTN